MSKAFVFFGTNKPSSQYVHGNLQPIDPYEEKVLEELRRRRQKRIDEAQEKKSTKA